MRHALDNLPPEQRQVVELAYGGGYSQREIAEMVGIPIGTVKGRMRLALEKLSSHLEARGVLEAEDEQLARPLPDASAGI